MNTYRQNFIREQIEKSGYLSIRELQMLVPDVSLMTIHRDLDALEQAGVLVKVRGGARSVRHAADIGFDVRLQENNAAKNIIARKALSLIQPGTAIFLDASTTNLVLARCLQNMDLNIFTTGPNIAIELCRHANVNITMCCGTVNRKNMALSGQNTLDMLNHINIDLAFIGVSGCSTDAGFTCGTENDSAVKNLVIRKARRSVIMCDKSKFSRLMPYTFARFSDVDYLVCEDAVPDAIAQAARAGGVQLL